MFSNRIIYILQKKFSIKFSELYGTKCVRFDKLTYHNVNEN